MTTATMEVKKAESAWTPEQEARIAQLMETEGISRPAAVRKMKAGNKPASQSKYSGVAPKNDRHSKVPVKPAKTAPKPKEAGDCHLSDAKQEEITKAVRRLIGSKAAVEGIVRSSLNPKWNLYIWYGLDNGKVVSVNIGKEVTAKFKEDDSWAVKEWKRIQARRLCREEKAKAKLDKEGKAAKSAK